MAQVAMTGTLALVLAACPGGQSGDNPLLHGMHEPSAAVQEGCRIAKRKCTRCHTMDQLLATRVSTPDAWRLYVHRMRLIPGAGIHAAEEPSITQCLVYRNFGQDGLQALEEPPQ